MLDVDLLFELGASWTTDVGAVDDTFRTECSKLKVACAEGGFTFATDKTGLIRIYRDAVLEDLSLRTAGDQLAPDFNQASV